ncbi:uncharacterized protein LOC143631690 [Bidens hawaiensis]|uniref:uncharacterized protein LOC143631690 n=1 Tax=Bidens hawaiensis TaxID=980011 RepID=UPI00404A00BC
MNFLSINIKGIGVESKAAWIRDIKLKEALSFLAFQETLAVDLESRQVARFWDNSSFDMEYVGATGRSGSLLCMWDSSVFKMSDSIKDRNFLLLKGSIVGCGDPLCILNVYAPQGTIEKKGLWNRISDLKDKHSGLWFLLGDFNIVRNENERRNSSFNPVRARDFNSFIFENNLVEYAMKGGKYTFSVGKKLSKIDRFLVCPGVMNLWPEACLRVLPRFLSDHRPLILIMKESNFGPRPFRFFNSWLDRKDFEETVRVACGKWQSCGPADLALVNKFKMLRNVIKVWWGITKGKKGDREQTLKDELENLETEMESRDLSEEEEWIRMESLKDLTELAMLKVKDLKQKSRVRWAMFGDDNSVFFHSFINNRKRKKLHSRDAYKWGMVRQTKNHQKGDFWLF